MAMGATDAGVVLGDPVPWFGAPLIGNGAFNLQVAAGRWIVLSFLGAPSDPKAQLELTELLRDVSLFHEDRIVFYGVFAAPPSDPAYYTALSTPAISFIADYDSTVSRGYGAADMPRTIVLDPMLRAVANIPWDHPTGHAAVGAQRAAKPACGRRFGRRALERAGVDRAARPRLSALRFSGAILRQARRQGFRFPP